MNCTINNIENWLKENLTKERFEHSLGTAECAKKLALMYGLDSDKAYFTGLIHDCAKCMAKDKTLEILKALPLEDGEFCNAKTHHAPVGAYIAKNEFGINDEEILSAIRWHTIGKVNMTMFEKIIFLADKIEERTRPKECVELINLLKEKNGLDKALLVCYKNTIKSLVDRNLPICSSATEIYNSLLKDSTNNV
ncbi:bis(5'-nucleosyl)-tetraphosphatase (symmetrical) YqeK [bacterium]|nr:bis(5'-nucleosyl)-tetraphosphatase (symmetrical) YqeK [bacterium]